MQRLQFIHRDLLCWPADDEALVIAGCRLGDDVEMDVVDFLETKVGKMVKSL